MTAEQRPAWAARIQAERENRGWSKAEMARRLKQAAGNQQAPVPSLVRQIFDWESGKHFPRDWQDDYATAFGTERAELFGPELGPDVDETRRHLLACLGMLGAHATVHADALDPIRHALSLAIFEQRCDHAIEDWEEIAFEHGHAFIATAPAILLPELAADLVALQEAIGTARSDSERKALCGPAGKLASLVAMTSSNLGEARQARDWWKTARHAADASGDRDLRVWVRGYEAMNALYAQRPLAIVLRRSDEALAIAGEDGCPAALEAFAARAQALSRMGRGSDAEATIHSLEDRYAALPAASAEDRLSTSAWPETALRHTQAYVFTHTRNTAQAGAAQDAALALYPQSMPRQRTQIELLRATCLVRQGSVSDGVQHASRAVERLGGPQRTLTILRGAHMVLDAIPEADSNTSAVRGYRELLALPAASR